MSFPKVTTPVALRSLKAFQLSSFTNSQQVRFYEVPHKVSFDQTKKDNSPKGEEDKSAKPQSGDKESHPQKQPDRQVSPSSSTGIETEGPGGSKAGKGGGSG